MIAISQRFEWTDSQGQPAIFLVEKRQRLLLIDHIVSILTVTIKSKQGSIFHPVTFIDEDNKGVSVVVKVAAQPVSADFDVLVMHMEADFEPFTAASLWHSARRSN